MTNKMLNAAIESLLENSNKQLKLASEATLGSASWQNFMVTGMLARILAEGYMAARNAQDV